MLRFVLVLLLPLGVLLVGCAHAIMGDVYVPLAPGVVTKNTLIQVETISTGGMGFAGDRATDRSLQGDDRFMIGDSYAALIVEALTDRGLRVELASGRPRSGSYLILSGHVSRHDRGSIYKRADIGGGAGESRLTSYFTLQDNVQGQVLTQFEIVDEIKQNNGPWEELSYLDQHLERSAKAVARYLTTAKVFKR